MTIEIEKGSFQDAVEVHREIPEFKDDYLGENRDRLENNDASILLATSNGDKVGYCISYDRYADGSLYIWMSGVTPDFRREGVMTRLLEETEARAQEEGYIELKVKTENRRYGMRQLLAKEGFNIIELDRKDKIPENKFLLQKNIDDEN